jgi:hypothetical protein
MYLKAGSHTLQDEQASAGDIQVFYSLTLLFL